MNKISLALPTAAVAVLAAALVGSSISAQAPEPQPSPAPQAPAGAPPQGPGGPPHFNFPAPTNLQVLPKNLTGQQVHEIMEGWEGQLGGRCDTCHAVDPTRKMPNGRPALNFADDSKKEKNTARLMYKMTEDINGNYVSKVENSGMPVTCGTCHRGHVSPEPFVPKEEHEHHDHEEHESAQPAQSMPH